MANNIKPIWQDYYIELSTEESPVNYSINLDGEAIFYGKAYCPPSHNQETFRTKINHICENYLSNDIDLAKYKDESGSFEMSGAVKTFVIKNEDKNVEIETVTFVYDWSYDPSVNYQDMVLMSKPITKTKEGMFVFNTRYNNKKVVTSVARTTINNSSCDSKWALYYLNRYGGWDSFLIEGYVSKKDSFDRKTVFTNYDNRTLNSGNRQYLTNITSSYEIHTGWLSQEESEIVAANVFQSTRVYLHNLETDEIIPIVISDADVLYKTHKNSGRKLLNYTINAIDAQTEHNKN